MLDCGEINLIISNGDGARGADINVISARLINTNIGIGNLLDLRGHLCQHTRALMPVTMENKL